MSLSILQSKNVPSAPTAGGASAKPALTGTGFKNLLDQAMKKGSPKSQTKLPQSAANGKVQKPEPRAKSSHAAVSHQTPALPAIVTNLAGNLPTAQVQGQPPDTDHAIANQSQRTMPQTQELEPLAARQFQPDPAAVQHAGSKRSTPGNVQAAPQLSNQKEEEPGSLPAGRKSQSKNSPIASASPASPAPGLKPESVEARVLPATENPEARTPANLVNALHPDKKSAAPAEAAALISQTGGAPGVTGTVIQTQPPAEGSTQAQAAQVPGKHFEKVIEGAKNLQVNVISTTTAQADAPLPSHAQDGKALAAHKADKSPSPDSATGIHQKQAAVNLQTGGKDTAASAAATTQDGVNTLPPNTAAAGSTGDTSQDGKSGQNPSARHAEISGSSTSGTGSTSSSFRSAAASAVAASAGGLATAPSQPAPANATPAGAGALPQPATSHAAAAARLSAADENPLNPVGGLVNSASLFRAQGKTEMRVALQTDNLGPVELHAVLDSGRVGASIAVVNHEAHTLLTNNLPALQQALTDQNLRLDHLSVLNTPVSTGTNTGTGGEFQSGAHTQPRNSTPRWVSSRHVQAPRGGEESSASATEGLRGRLSVHA